MTTRDLRARLRAEPERRTVSRYIEEESAQRFADAVMGKGCDGGCEARSGCSSGVPIDRILTSHPASDWNSQVHMTTPADDRFPELRSLLGAYEWTGSVFDDTLEAPGPALSAYLRMAAHTPSRAAAVVREIDDLLEVGLFSEEIADDVDLLPHIEPPRGVSVEDCLGVVRQHLGGFLREPTAPVSTARPQISWEWRERFPALTNFLGAYFHQDFDQEYQSHAEAVDDYLSGEPREEVQKAASEIADFLAVNPSDDELDAAADILGLSIDPPDDVSLRRWLTDIQGIITHHLRTSTS